jgi:hypothetical protein
MAHEDTVEYGGTFESCVIEQNFPPKSATFNFFTLVLCFYAWILHASSLTGTICGQWGEGIITTDSDHPSVHVVCFRRLDLSDASDNF